MVTTKIELEIESIANVTDANANFILSAQKSKLLQHTKRINEMGIE